MGDWVGGEWSSSSGIDDSGSHMNLSTTYMGLALANPVVPSASPLSRDIDNIKRMADAGAGAVILYSLFEEQIRHEAEEFDFYMTQGTDSFAEALSYFPDLGDYNLGPREYLTHVEKAKQAVDIPVIASLNGCSPGGWTDYAHKIQQAGADALELNIYWIPTDTDQTAQDVEDTYVRIVLSVKESVSIPVAVKVAPYFSSPAAMAAKLDRAGADALVLFNRFYQPDIDVTQREVVPRLVLSTSDEGRLPMRWIAILFGHVSADLAATTGIHTAEDAVKMLMAGATVTMMCSALLQHGVGAITEVVKGIETFLAENNFGSLDQLRGSMSHQSCADPGAFERANYMKVLKSSHPVG